MAFDEKTCEDRTYFRKRRMQDMKSKVVLYDDDPNKEERLEKHLCKSCFYVYNSGWAGQAFTTVKCEDCDKEMTFGSTDTDNFCDDCAIKNNVCKHCGAEMD